MSAESRIPLLSVTLEGMPLDLSDAQALERVQVRQRLSQPTHCELIFSNPQGRCAERNQALPGSRLRLTVEGHSMPLFSGRVSAAEFSYHPSGERKLTLRAYDALHRLRHRQPVRAHVQLTLAELAQELTSDIGISLEAVEKGPAWEKIVQAGQSDLDLLQETATRSGLYFFLDQEVLKIISLQGVGEEIPLEQGESLYETRIEVNADPACEAVTVLGWDPWCAEQHRGSSTNARSGRRISASTSGRPEQTLLNASIQDDTQATGLAQAEHDRREALSVRLTGVASGNPRLRPGVRVKLTGVDSPVSGRYVLCSATHTLDRLSGFVTEIDTWPPTQHTPSRESVTTLGVVSDINDPDALGRVRVTLPAYADVESDWFEVLSPGAGRNKGLVTLPEVGDRVLILLTRNDPAQGLVVGGFYGVDGPPDDGIESGEIRRFTLTTSGGQRLQLDDTQKRVRLENSGKNRLELKPGCVRIRNDSGCYVEMIGKQVKVHAEELLELEAPGGSVVIRGSAIDFVHG